MTQAAIDMLTEEIEREREFQTTDEWDGKSNIVPVLEEMLAQIRAGNAPTTVGEVDEWSMKIYWETAAGGPYGDDDVVIDIEHSLLDALGIEYDDSVE